MVKKKEAESAKKIKFEFKKVKIDPDEEVYPEFSSPSTDACHLAVELLGELHGIPTKGERTMSVLDALVRVILSQNTTDKTSRVAFMSLKAAFPTYAEVHAAVGTGRVEESIRFGGLADMKAHNIHNILAYLLQEHPEKCLDNGIEPSYEWLRDKDTLFCKEELLKHKGVGPKSVSCVLMFNLHRDDFPVDTHVWHISKLMKWAPAACNAEKCYTHMNNRVPGELKYPLHILLVEHGKRCRRCAKNGKLQLPEEGSCPLVNFSEKLEKYRARPPGTVSSPSKAYVPWYVKTEGCEMVKEQGTKGSSSGKKRKVSDDTAAAVTIKEEPVDRRDTKSAKSIVDTAGGASTKIKTEPVGDNDVLFKTEAKETPPISGRGKPKKILQHLDMQG